MRVEVDPDACIACGLCVESCPEVFEMDDDSDIAITKAEEVPEDSEECAEQAAGDCPVGAIIVE